MKYIFIMFVYAYKDGDRTINSIEVRLVDKDMESAEKRALEVAGTDERNKVLTKTIIEKDD